MLLPLLRRRSSVNDKLWGTPGLNANAFLLGIASFGLAALLFGTWVERNGPYAAVRVTIVFTPAGWALACLGTALPNYGVEMLFGVCHGIGVGFAYIAVTSCLQRWFSEFKGLATGIAVMGFGLGSFFWTTLGHALMDPLGPVRTPVPRGRCRAFLRPFSCAAWSRPSHSFASHRRGGNQTPISMPRIAPAGAL